MGVSYSVGDASGNKPFASADLRRRLLVKIGKPLTASAADNGKINDTGISGEESIAQEALHSLVSSVYEAVAAKCPDSTSVPQEKPNGVSK